MKLIKKIIICSLIVQLTTACIDRDKHPQSNEATLLSGSKSTGQTKETAQVELAYQQRLESVENEPNNWLLHGQSFSGQRFSSLTSINVENVNQLGLDWFVDFPRDGGQEATPIVVDGVIYLSTAWSLVHAINAKTGETIWQYDPQVPREVLVRACCGPVNRGVAVWEDKVLVGTFDGRVVAINKETGKEVWSTRTFDFDSLYTITGAPLVANGKVFIGNGGAEFGARGFVVALDIETGKEIWRFYTVPGDPSKPFENEAMEMAAKTWNGEWWKVGGGGTAYDALSYDPETNLFFIGVGNSSPYDPIIRTNGEGDNLFVSSIVAIDADTGKYAWHYQTTPQDSWDYTATQNMIFADLDIDGTVRKVVMQAPKNGFFYVLDRITGEFISAEAFEKVTWAKGIDENGRPIVNEDAKYWKNGKASIYPSALGAHNWQPMAYSPASKLVYIPANHMPSSFKRADKFQSLPIGRNTGLDYSDFAAPEDPKIIAKIREAVHGKLIAWNPVKQTEVWSIKQNEPGNGGVLTTQSNLVFQGRTTGEFNAYHAETGEKLWEFDSQTAVIAAPVSYAVEGEQYIAVMAGRGGAIGRSAGPYADTTVINRSRLLVFKLGADNQLPDKNDLVLPLPDMTQIAVDEDRVKSGAGLYNQFCASCHGFNAVGGSVAPDLRYSGFTLAKAAFDQVLINGVLKDRGMVSFAPVMSESQVEDVRHYLVHQNNTARKYGETSRIGR